MTIQERKEKLLEKIGNYYGNYEKDGNNYIFHCGGVGFEYKSVDAGLIDWYSIIKEDPTGLWSDDVQFIEQNCHMS